MELFYKTMIFDVFVLGGGHAGIEAAQIASQFDLKVALAVMPGVFIASAPCNPSIGGVGKGQVVRELDVLGGVMGILADKAGIQYRILNESKGYAVQSTRVQIDKVKYTEEAEKLIASNDNISVIREMVLSFDQEANGEFIIKTDKNLYKSKKLIVTAGTFLNGKLHTGSTQTIGGRVDCNSAPSMGSLNHKIKSLSVRFKTGTPARLNRSTIDYSKLEPQPSDPNTKNFHIMNSPYDRNSEQVSCFLGYTNAETLKVIRDNKERSPMYNGQIKGVGARYCPSIEDKAYRYPDRDIHHVFIEPEGINIETMYPSGISSSLPEDVQDAFIRTIPGLEKVKVEKYGYAVEYDVVDTSELSLSLEYKTIPGLYFAGQVNGTSGYEEAAGQGLVAGINAALSLLNREPLILNRSESYIGVLISDLVLNERDEPYRLFTARSENRLFIREDNTLERIYPYRSTLYLNKPLDVFCRELMDEKSNLEKICSEVALRELATGSIGPEVKAIPLWQNFKVSELMKQSFLDPVTTLRDLLLENGLTYSEVVIANVAINLKYDGYVKKYHDQFEKIKKLDGMKISWDDICNSKNISFECKQRVQKIKPNTFGELKLIEGIRPATLAIVAGKIY